MSTLADLYDTDYAQWASRNARLPRAGDLGARGAELRADAFTPAALD